MPRLIIISICIFCLSSTLRGQTNGEREIKNYFEAASLGNNYYISAQELKNIDTININQWAIPQLRNESSFIRFKALDLIKRYGLLNDDILLLQTIVFHMVTLCKDADSGVAGSAITALKLYPKKTFNQKAIDEVNIILKEKKNFHYNDFILIAGFVGNFKTMEILSEMLASDSSLNLKEKWKINLALSRLGDEDSFNYCFSEIKKQGMNDKVVDILLAELAYTRNISGIDFLLQLILSDSKNCTTRTPDFEEDISCAYKIMELVAPCIIDFPVSIDKYGDLQTNDINTSLSEVRNWIHNKRTTHINIERY